MHPLPFSAGEDLLQAFLDAYKAVKSSPSDAQSRSEVLRALSQVPGIYCPSLYVLEYEAPDGPLVGLNRVAEDVPETVKKQTYRGNTLARSTVVSEKMAWENIYMVEVRRASKGFRCSPSLICETQLLFEFESFSHRFMGS